MKIAVWKTGHEIADTVADSLHRGFGGVVRNLNAGPSEYILTNESVNIGYGILRGMDHMTRQAGMYNEHWFLLDRGYFNPSHYDGYYRISYKGTQARYDESYPCLESGIIFKPIRNGGVHIMICPPSVHVCKFFGIDQNDWTFDAMEQAKKTGYPAWIRNKDCNLPLEKSFEDCFAVITFNSSVGWQALQRGIPCLSDPLHSVVGSYYKIKEFDNLAEKFNSLPREPLFNFMNSHQFTLAGIEQGKAWPLINHYLSITGLRDPILLAPNNIHSQEISVLK